jgi:chromate transporter
VSDLLRLTWTFLWLSLLCIGGGLGILPEMQRQVVERHQWVSAREFVDGYALSQLTPGPTMLVVVFVGYRAHGWLGALLAGLATFVPTSLLVAVIARRWRVLRERPWARSTERALGPIGIGLMAAGVFTLGRAAMSDGVSAAIALAGFAVLSLCRVPPFVVVLAGGLAAHLARGS